MTKAERIAELLRNEGAEVNVVPVVKGGHTMDGLQIGSGSVRQCVYPEKMSGTDEEIVDQIINIVNCDIPQFDLEVLSNWEEAKKKLVICLRPVNEDDMAVTKKFLDMEMYVKVLLDNGCCTKVTVPMLDMYGICEDVLFDAAIRNSEFEIKSMYEKMLDLMPEGEEREMLLEMVPDDDNGMWVGSNESYVDGAAILVKPDAIKELADEFGEDLYILPSSIHEVLLLKTSIANPSELRQMVHDVNETEVQPEERLSYNVYRYCRAEGKVIFA